MNKKIIIILAGALVILGGLGFTFKDKLFKTSQITPLIGEKEATPKKKFTFEWEKWQDPAGFAFEYPKEVKIDNHMEDETNYAHLELTKEEREGKITIIVNATEYADLNQWATKDESVKNSNFLETEIASISAKRVSLGERREIAAFIDSDQVIYTITLENNGQEKEYWQEIYNQILSSFHLIPLEGESKEDFSNWLGGFETEGVDIVEPVEVIE